MHFLFGGSKMYFWEKRHEKRIRDFFNESKIEYLNTELATIYLLTADEQLWKKAQDGIENGKLDFKKIKLKGINIRGYAFCKVAMDIYNGNASHMDVKDLANKNVISNNVYRVIEQALQICRFGIKINKKRTSITNNR